MKRSPRCEQCRMRGNDCPAVAIITGLWPVTKGSTRMIWESVCLYHWGTFELSGLEITSVSYAEPCNVLP